VEEKKIRKIRKIKRVGQKNRSLLLIF